MVLSGPRRWRDGSKPIEPIERWMTKRRVALVVSVLRVETFVAEAAQTDGLTLAEVEEWQEKFRLGPRMPCGVA
jgi:hypothetical protein